MYYLVEFNNKPERTRVFATSRADAIKQAARMTRGYLSLTQQKANVVSCKISKFQ